MITLIWVFGRRNIQDLVHSLLKLSTGGKMLPNNSDIQGKERETCGGRWVREVGDRDQGRKNNRQICLWWHSQFLHGTHPISYSLFSTPKPACLTSPSPLLPTCSSLHYPENLLKIYHVLLDYKPSLLFSYANHMKSGQHLLCLVSSQLSTRAAFAIWSPLSFYRNCFLEGHPQLWLPKP